MKDKAIELYNKLLSGEYPRITYSKGYKEFEDLYELYKNDLEREEQDLLVVVRRKNGTEISN